MLEQDVDTTLKVIVVGNGQVGKTSMITRFAKGIFTNEYKKTIGVDFLEKKMFLNSIGEDITFLLWDTAGQEEYAAITRTYYKGAGACILAFSTTDRASFDAIESWYQKVTDECGQISMCLVQNKVDLMDDAAMSPQEVEYMAIFLKFRHATSSCGNCLRHLAKTNDCTRRLRMHGGYELGRQSGKKNYCTRKAEKVTVLHRVQASEKSVRTCREDSADAHLATAKNYCANAPRKNKCLNKHMSEQRLKILYSAQRRKFHMSCLPAYAATNNRT